MFTDPLDVSPDPPVKEVTPQQKSREHFFRTDHLHADLKGRSVRGGMVTLSAQGGKFVLNLVSTMALARLLSPAEFGVVAMVSPVTGFISLFKDLGLSLATVQREDINHDQVSTLFWINVFASVALALIAAAISPLVGLFYGDVRTTWVTLATAGTFIFGGLSAQHSALLSRNMRFGLLALVDISSMTISIFTGILTAWLGWSYWSLVAMSISGGLVGCTAVWIASPWRPGRPQRHVGTRSMLKFGGGMTAVNILAYICTQLDRVALGSRLFHPPGMTSMTPAELIDARQSTVGVYSRAQSMFLAPLFQIMTPLMAVMIPTFSRLAKNRARLGSAAIQLMELATAVALPMSLVAFLCAPAVVRILLGSNPQWLPAVAITRAFGVMALGLPAAMVVNAILTATGRSDILFKWEFGWLCVLLAAIGSGLPWGGIGVAISISTAWVIVMPIYMYIGHRVGEVPLRGMGMLLLRNCASAGLCVGGVLAVRRIAGPTGPWVDVIMCAITIAVIHGTVLWSTGTITRVKNLFQLARPRTSAQTD